MHVSSCPVKESQAACAAAYKCPARRLDVGARPLFSESGAWRDCRRLPETRTSWPPQRPSPRYPRMAAGGPPALQRGVSGASAVSEASMASPHLTPRSSLGLPTSPNGAFGRPRLADLRKNSSGGVDRNSSGKSSRSSSNAAGLRTASAEASRLGSGASSGSLGGSCLDGSLGAGLSGGLSGSLGGGSLGGFQRPSGGGGMGGDLRTVSESSGGVGGDMRTASGSVLQRRPSGGEAPLEDNPTAPGGDGDGGAPDAAGFAQLPLKRSRS